MWNSLLVGTSATLLATLLGTLAALGLWRARFPGQGLLLALLISPMVVPVVIVAVGVYFAFAPLGLTDGYAGLILAHTTLARAVRRRHRARDAFRLRSHAAARGVEPRRDAAHRLSPRDAAADPSRRAVGRAHGRGVQLYPAPTNARVYDNVIDHAGEGFVIGNEPGDTASGNEIYNNVITNSTGLATQGIPGQGIHDLYGGKPGSGNSFYDNILYGNPGGIGPLTAVEHYDNTIANPRFSDPVAHDYTPLPASPAATWGIWSGRS